MLYIFCLLDELQRCFKSRNESSVLLTLLSSTQETMLKLTRRSLCEASHTTFPSSITFAFGNRT